MLFTKFLFTLVCVSLTKGMNCTQDNFYVTDQSDLNNLANCSTIDGNLIINSGFSVDNFQVLENVETISGYLFMFDNHNVSSLFGLHNLIEVEGNELYLGTYSIVIKYNRNEQNTTHDGLCYTNTVNWTTITSEPVDIRNNGANCPDCHPQCVGCFGPGPEACQGCSNYDYATVCVQNCPGNYTNFTCDEVLPSKPSLTGNLVGLNEVFLSWNKTNINDFVSGFNIWMNDVLNYSYTVSNLGYYYDEIPFNHSLYGLNYETNYSFEVSFVNHLGESNRSNLVLVETSPLPTTTSTTTVTTTSVTRTTSTSTTVTRTSSTVTTSTRTVTRTSTTQTGTSLTTTLTRTTTGTSTPTTTGTSTPNVNTANEENHNTSKRWWNDLNIIPIVLFVGILCIIVWIYYYIEYMKTRKVVPAESVERQNPAYTGGNSYSGFETSNDYSYLARDQLEQSRRTKTNPVYSA